VVLNSDGEVVSGGGAYRRDVERGGGADGVDGARLAATQWLMTCVEDGGERWPARRRTRRRSGLPGQRRRGSLGQERSEAERRQRAVGCRGGQRRSEADTACDSHAETACARAWARGSHAETAD
jgi:hypothetical protein